MGRNRKRRQEHLERTRRRKESKKCGSKRKKVRAKQKQTPQVPRPEPVVFAVEYYHAAFAQILQTLQLQGYGPGPSPKRKSFWQLIPPGDYTSDKAREFLNAYLRSLEAAMQEVIERCSLAYWHHVYRRFAPTPIGDNDDPTTIHITRAVLDAAIQKYAKTDFCDRIGVSNQVDPGKILNGFLMESGATAMLQALANAPQLVLTDFGPNEYREALQLEKLAYEVWRTMAQLRIVGKGAPLVVSGGGEWVEDDRGDDLDFLVTHFDRRGSAFYASATGTVFTSEVNAKGFILLPRWNAEQTSFDALRPIFERFLKRPLVTPSPRIAPNFVWLPMNLASYYNAHNPFSEPFRERNGVSLESVVAVIAALIDHLYVTWTRWPFYFLRMWQRAYDAPGKPEDIKRWIREHVPIAIKLNGLPFDAADVDVDAAFTYLSLNSASRSQIDIAYGGPHAVFIPNGTDQVFIDYAYLFLRLNYLFYGVNLADQNFKGAALETFTHRGASVLPTGELRAKDGTSRQIDAAFELGKMLVICECRAVARSLAVEKGEPQALDFRKRLIDRTLTDIDEKAAWLLSNRVGANYDVSSYEGILPIGVTPFKEYIHSRDRRYWVDHDLPRVLSPGELRDAIADGSLAAAASRTWNNVRLD